MVCFVAFEEAWCVVVFQEALVKSSNLEGKLEVLREMQALTKEMSAYNYHS